MIGLPRRALMALVAAGALLSPVAAAAHRGHGALSVVELDARTGEILVSHRFQTHEVEPALARVAPEAQPSLDDPDAVTALTAYVGALFTLKVAGAPVDLTLKDMTLGADEVRMVYAGRIPVADAVDAVDVQAAMFADVFEDQVNQVNVRRLGVTRTLVFQGDGGEQSLAALD